MFTLIACVAPDPIGVSQSPDPADASRSAAAERPPPTSDAATTIVALEGAAAAAVTLTAYGSAIIAGSVLVANTGTWPFPALAAGAVVLPLLLSTSFIVAFVATAFVAVGHWRAGVVAAAGSAILMATLGLAGSFAAISVISFVLAYQAGDGDHAAGPFAIVGPVSAAAGIGVYFLSPFVTAIALSGGPLLLRSAPAVDRCLPAQALDLQLQGCHE